MNGRIEAYWNVFFQNESQSKTIDYETDRDGLAEHYREVVAPNLIPIVDQVFGEDLAGKRLISVLYVNTRIKIIKFAQSANAQEWADEDKMKEEIDKIVTQELTEFSEIILLRIDSVLQEAFSKYENLPPEQALSQVRKFNAEAKVELKKLEFLGLPLDIPPSLKDYVKIDDFIQFTKEFIELGVAIEQSTIARIDNEVHPEASNDNTKIAPQYKRGLYKTSQARREEVISYYRTILKELLESVLRAVPRRTPNQTIILAEVAKRVNVRFDVSEETLRKWVKPTQTYGEIYQEKSEEFRLINSKLH